MPGPSDAPAPGAIPLPSRFGPWAPPSLSAVVAAAGIATLLALTYLAGSDQRPMTPAPVATEAGS